MMKMKQSIAGRMLRVALKTGFAAALVAVMQPAAQAQTATVSGALSGFDVVNDSGRLVHGFEIRMEGAVLSDLYYTLPGQRYGTAVVTPTPTGVNIRYSSPYDSATHQFTKTTPMYQPGTPFSWNDCYAAGTRYAVSGCEHFGQSMKATLPGQITSVKGYWLVEDAAVPGTLISLPNAVVLPYPVWAVVTPPTAPTATPPVVQTEVEAPEPPEAPELYGNAQWIKVYKTELPREITAEELSSNNPSVVPEDPTQIEVSWDILQADPAAGGGNGNRNRNRRQNQGNISPTTRSVIRRYELYKYTGAYDAISHQVACADGTCTAPSAGELGDAISVQNTAVNIVPDVVQISRSGSGTVTTSNGINCGNACAAFAPKGSTVTISENAGNSAFMGWSGACAGNQATCAVVVSGVTGVGATFLPQFTLSIGRSNPGTVVGTPAGTDRAINCGGNCSAKFPQGTSVTLTAIPPAGKTFVNWADACSGTVPTCTVTINGSAKVQAVFSK